MDQQRLKSIIIEKSVMTFGVTNVKKRTQTVKVGNTSLVIDLP